MEAAGDDCREVDVVVPGNAGAGRVWTVITVPFAVVTVAACIVALVTDVIAGSSLEEAGDDGATSVTCARCTVTPSSPRAAFTGVARPSDPAAGLALLFRFPSLPDPPVAETREVLEADLCMPPVPL